MKSHSLEAKYFQMNSRVQWSEWQEWWYDHKGNRIDPCTRGVSLSDSRSSHQCGKGNRSCGDACNCAGDSGGTGYGSAAEEQPTEVPSATAETRTVIGKRAGTMSSPQDVDEDPAIHAALSTLRASRAAKRKNAKLRKKVVKQEAAAKDETQVDGSVDANKGNGEPVVQRECSVQCPSGQSEVGALPPAQSEVVGQFLAHLVGAGHFDTCTLNFLPVGHTHEDVDLVFGNLSKT